MPVTKEGTLTEVFRQLKEEKWKFLCLILLCWIYGYFYLLAPVDNISSAKVEDITAKPSWKADVYWKKKFKRLEALYNRSFIGPGKKHTTLTCPCNVLPLTSHFV